MRRAEGTAGKRRTTPTLRDVADLAGVGPSAASKVLNGQNINVRPETRERILEAATHLGYRPNAYARGLRLQSSGALGMLLPDITNPVYATIVRGAVQRANQLGYSLLLAEIAPENAEDAYERLVQEKRIDGLLIATARRTGRVSSRLLADNVPHVFVNRRLSGTSPCVTVDDAAGAALAAQTLAHWGHRSLGIVSGPLDVDTAVRRLAGFREATTSLDLPRPKSARGDYTPAGGYQAMAALLSARSRPTGVFVSNFVASVGALRAIHDAGLRVPDDMSLIAFDDGPTAEFMVPRLTCVRMPFEQLGAVAIDVLSSVLEGHSHADVIVSTPPYLTVRESVSAPRNPT